MMYCWGNTSNGELGLGGIEEDNVLVPTQSDFKEARYIKQGRYCRKISMRRGTSMAENA